MRKLIAPVIIGAFAALFVATFAIAQPGLGITKTAPLSGTGSAGSPWKITVCANGEVYQSNGTSWVCTTPSAGTTVTADDGINISGGGELDLDYTSDFQITADQLDMSTTVTLPGSLAVTTTTLSTGLITATAGVTTSANLTTTGTGDLVSADDVTAADDLFVTGDTRLGLDNGAQVTTFGFDTDSTTNAQPGHRIETNSGVIYHSTHTNTAATEVFRIGAGTSNGATNTWLTIAGATGQATLGMLLTASGGVTTAANLTTTGGGDLSVADDAVIGGDLSVGAHTTVATLGLGSIAPAAISGTVNDWAPTSISVATVIRIAASGTATINGLTTGSDGRIVELVNASSEQITFAHEAAGSTAGNRFTLTSGNNQVLIASRGDSIRFIYDGPNSRWTEIEHTTQDRLYVTNEATIGTSLAVSTSMTVNDSSTLGADNADTTTIWGKAYYSGTAPTLTTCTSTCSMAAYSTDARGRITCSDDSGADCTVTFSVAYSTNAPACTLTYEDATAPAASPYIKTASTTAFTFDQVGGAQAHAYVYHCDGML